MGNCFSREDRRQDDRLKQYRRHIPNQHPSPSPEQEDAQGQGTSIPNSPQSQSQSNVEFPPRGSFDINELWRNLFLERNVEERMRWMSMGCMDKSVVGKQIVPGSLSGSTCLPSEGPEAEVLGGTNIYNLQGQNQGRNQGEKSLGRGDPEQQFEFLISHELLPECFNDKEAEFSDTPLVIGVHMAEVRVVGGEAQQGNDLLLSVPVWNVLSDNPSLLGARFGIFYLRGVEGQPELNNTPVELVKPVSFVVVEDTKKEDAKGEGSMGTTPAPVDVVPGLSRENIYFQICEGRECTTFIKNY